MMSLVIIFLSYFLGCISTIVLIIYVYIRYGLGLPGIITEQEQYQISQPLAENDLSKNSAVDTVNYLIQFLFQEMKDSAKIRRYITKKLKVEFDMLKNTRIGKLFLQDIIIQSFSLGKECLILSDIQLDRQERDERQLLTEYVAKLDGDYRDGFSVTLLVTLSFGQTCQIYIKVKRIHGQLRLELRREPFSHWLFVFQDEPFIDLDVKAFISTRESTQLAHIIKQQIRRAIRRKQVWPNYKIRYQPFFPTSKQPSSPEDSPVINRNLVAGKFHVTFKHCDRLSIPFEIFEKEKSSLLFIFLTININKQMCQDYLRLNRQQWRREKFEFIPHLHRIVIKEVFYMDHTEFLIEALEPIPDGIEDLTGFKMALEDRNVFLLQIQGREVKKLKQTNCLWKKSKVSTEENKQKLQVIIGIPILHSVQVKRVSETEAIDQQNKRSFGTLQEPIADNSIPQEVNKKNVLSDMVSLVMMNADFLHEFQTQATLTQKAAAYVELDDKFEFQTGSDEEFLNICLWCKPPLDFDVPNAGSKLILLGYTTVALSEIVLDARMSFKRETQMTLNFRSPNSSKSNLNDYTNDPKKKKLAELSTHKKYDDNMAHGFVTINVRHEPDIENKINHESKKDPTVSIETIRIENEPLISNNERDELLSTKSNDHIFDDLTFGVGGTCAYCNKTIWIKAGRQCRKCLITVHKKCEDKYKNENICTDSENNNDSIDDTDSISTMNQIKASRSATNSTSLPTTFDSTVRRSFRTIGNKNSNLIQPELSSPSSHTSSKLGHVASTAYNKLLEFKAKRLPFSSSSETKKIRATSVSENISEDDLQDIITKYLSDENADTNSLENLFHEKSVDHTMIYAKANQFGPELFRDLTLDERKQKLNDQISRLQQEFDLQDQIRDELIMEYNSEVTDENTKRKIQARIMNVDEKVQALVALTLLYCSGLRHCCAQMEATSDN